MFLKSFSLPSYSSYPPRQHDSILILRFQIIAVITPYLVGTNKGDANLGAKVFFLWGALCCISTAFAYFLVPETKGLSLEQVDKMMEEVNARHSASWVPHSTFAQEMGLTEKGLSISAPTEDIKAAVATHEVERSAL